MISEGLLAVHGTGWENVVLAEEMKKDSEFRETNDDKIGGFLFSLSSIFFLSTRGDDERGEDFSDQFWKWDGNKLLKAPLLAFTRTLDVRRA